MGLSRKTLPVDVGICVPLPGVQSVTTKITFLDFLGPKNETLQTNTSWLLRFLPPPWIQSVTTRITSYIARLGSPELLQTPLLLGTFHHKVDEWNILPAKIIKYNYNSTRTFQEVPIKP